MGRAQPRLLHRRHLGLSYREFDTGRGPWLLPTTTPVQFEPGPLRATVLRLMSYRPDSIYLTHYGRIGDVQRLGADLLEQLVAMVALGRSLRDEPDRHEAIKRGLMQQYQARVASHGCRFTPDEVERLLASVKDEVASYEDLSLGRRDRRRPV